MRYKLLGRSGLRVSELCLGTMTFGEDWGFGADLETSRGVFEAFAEAGGNFIDTANHYTNGTSERFLGELIASERDRFVLATKYTLNGRPDDPNGGGNHRKSMMAAVEGSLRRLNTDHIDLYWVHAWDFLTPIEEVMRGLDDLVRQGKVLYVGISDAPAWVVSSANTLADLRGWSRFVGLQVRYSLIDRDVERELLPMAQAMDVAVTPWAPLSAGLLTGKYTRGGEAGGRLSGTGWGGSMMTEANLAIARAVDAVADELGCTSAQVALAWLRTRPGVIVPIVGARTRAQLEDNLGALQVTLSDAHLAHLDEVSRIVLGFPHDFLRSDGVRQVIYGNTRAQIDDHRGQMR